MDALTSTLVPFVVLVATSLLASSAKPFAKVEAGRWVVHYGWGFKGFALFSAGIPLALFFVLYFVPPPDRVWIVWMIILFGLPATYLVLEGFCVRVAFSIAGIEAYSPWRKNRKVSWTEVRGVSYEPVAKWHRIAVEDQGYIRLHEMMSGVPELLEELRRRGVAGA